jgi:hypothetical protein
MTLVQIFQKPGAPTQVRAKAIIACGHGQPVLLLAGALGGSSPGEPHLRCGRQNRPAGEFKHQAVDR